MTRAYTLALLWPCIALAQPTLSYPTSSPGTVTSRVTYPLDPAAPQYEDESPSASWRDATCATPARVAHTGIDISMPAGTPVFAAADATAVISATDNCPDDGDSDCNHGYGNAVVLRHADDYATRYAHLLYGSVPPLTGAVACGTFVGLVGSSGSSSGPHLHFEVRGDVTGSSTYRTPAYDALGGDCALSTTALFASGTTMTCAPSGMPGYIAMVDADSTTRIVTAADAPYSIRLVFRNIGSASWSPSSVALIRLSDDGTGGTPARWPLALEAPPGGEGVFELTAIAPERAGTFELRYGVALDGAPFQAFVTIALEVIEGGSCESASLGRSVPGGECVQSRDSCGWFVCNGRGGWLPVRETQCLGVAHPSAVCACSGYSICDHCVSGDRCTQCDGRCVDADAAPSCTVAIDEPEMCVSPELCGGAAMCVDSTMRVICQGESGLASCPSGVQLCTCGASGALEMCGPCLPVGS